MPGSVTTEAASQFSNDNDQADFGDFVSTEDEELDLEEIVEPWQKYSTEETSHVFYPIHVGEVLNERYLIEHKIGFGGFSTAWMACDLQLERDVALKVMSSGEGQENEWQENEVRFQNEFLQQVRDRSHLVTPLTDFLLPGFKCHHRVLVFPLMGPCLRPIILRKMSITTRMSAARQLLEALKNLHEAGIVHRDLNDRNCMWGMTSTICHLNRAAKYKAFGRPLKQTIPFVDLTWKKGELVSPIEVPADYRTEEFYLGDFGLATKIDDDSVSPPRGYPPMQFCSPDRLHKEGPSFACDMWSYMIIFGELYLGLTPFHTWRKGGILTALVRCLGPLPERWKGLYTHPGGFDSWYDQSNVPDPSNNLASVIAYFRPDADSAEREQVHSVMSRVFTYYPEKRPTAAQLLQDSTFRAIMGRYGC